MNDSLFSAVLKIRTEIDKGELTRTAEKAADAAAREMVDEFADAGKEAGEKAGKEFSEKLKDKASKGAKESSKKVEEEMSKAGGFVGTVTSDSFNKMAEKIGKAGAVMTAGFTLPVLYGAKKAVDAFADYEDAVEATAFLMGDQKEKLDDWVKSSADFFNMSKKEAYEAAVLLAPVLQNFLPHEELGDAVAAALERSTELVSLYGTNVDQVNAAFRSFLDGQVIPAKRYSVFSSEATRALKAVELGLIDLSLREQEAAMKVEEAHKKELEAIEKHGPASREAAKAQIELAKAEEKYNQVMEGRGVLLNEAQKQLVQYALWMEQTEVAVGHVASSTETLLYKKRDMAQQAQDASVALGGELAPAAEKIYEALGKIANVINEMPDWAVSAGIWTAAIGAAVGPVMTLTSGVMKLVGWLGKAAAAFRTFGAAQAAATVAGGAASTGGGLLGGLFRKGGAKAAARAGGKMAAKRGVAALGPVGAVAAGGLLAWDVINHDFDGDGRPEVRGWMEDRLEGPLGWLSKNVFHRDDWRKAEEAERRAQEADRRYQEALRQRQASGKPLPAGFSGGTHIDSVTVMVTERVDGETLRRELDNLGRDMTYRRHTPGR